MSERYEGNVAKLIDRLRSSWRIIVALRGAMRYITQHSRMALRAADRIRQVPKPAIDRFRVEYCSAPEFTNLRLSALRIPDHQEGRRMYKDTGSARHIDQQEWQPRRFCNLAKALPQDSEAHR